METGYEIFEDLQYIKTPRKGNFDPLFMYVLYGHIQSVDQPGMVTNPARGQLAEQGKTLRIWSRETGSAGSSRITLVVLHTQAESGVYSRAPLLPLAFREGVSSIFTVNGHDRSSPSRDFLCHAFAYPMAFIAENPPAQGLKSSRLLAGLPIFRYSHGPILDAHLSFRTPTHCMNVLQWCSGHVRPSLSV